MAVLPPIGGRRQWSCKQAKSKSFGQRATILRMITGSQIKLKSIPLSVHLYSVFQSQCYCNRLYLDFWIRNSRPDPIGFAETIRAAKISRDHWSIPALQDQRNRCAATARSWGSRYKKHNDGETAVRWGSLGEGHRVVVRLPLEPGTDANVEEMRTESRRYVRL